MRGAWTILRVPCSHKIQGSQLFLVSWTSSFRADAKSNYSRLSCSYIAQRQQQKLRSCYFDLFCNGLSSIMTRTVAITSPLTYLLLALVSWLFMDQASSLMLRKALSAMEAVVEVLFTLYIHADNRYFDL